MAFSRIFHCGDELIRGALDTISHIRQLGLPFLRQFTTSQNGGHNGTTVARRIAVIASDQFLQLALNCSRSTGVTSDKRHGTDSLSV